MHHGEMKLIILLIAPLILGLITQAKDSVQSSDAIPVIISRSPKILTHQVSDLKDFRMADIKLNNLDFEASIKLLKNSYSNICEETNDTTLPLEFKIHKSASKRKVSVTLHGTFENMLNQLCAIHSIQYKQVGNTFQFSSLKTSVDEIDPVVTVSISLPPDSFNFGPSQQQLKILANSEKLITKWSKPQASLIVSGKQSEVSHLTRIAKSLYHFRPIQAKVGIKIISYDPTSSKLSPILKQSLTQSIFDEAQTKLLFRNFSKQIGINVNTLPSIVSRINEEASIQLFNEVPTPKSPLSLGHEFKINVHSIKGLSVDMNSSVIYDYISGMKFEKSSTLPANMPKEIKPKKYQAQMKTQGRDRSTHLFKVNIPESNLDHWITMQISLMDATGRLLQN